MSATVNLPADIRRELRMESDLSSGIWAIHRNTYEKHLTWLYAFQMDIPDGPIKVGITENPRQRLWSLQTGSPYELKVLACWRGFPFEEKWLGGYHATARLRGEWYRPAPDLLELLRDLGDEYQGWDQKGWGSDL